MKDDRPYCVEVLWCAITAKKRRRPETTDYIRKLTKTEAGEIYEIYDNHPEVISVKIWGGQ